MWKKGEWKRTEHRKRWKLLHNLHALLEGNPVWAVMKFEPARDWQIARLQSRGDLLVDTGACVSVCKPDAFGAKVDRSAKQDLYSVDDTLLKSRGECRPVLNVGSGEHRQDVTVTFQVVEGITDNILSVNRAVDAGATVVFSPDECYIQWADGGKASFHRQGKQFILPYEELTGKPSRQVKIAPVIDEEAAAVEAYAALDRPDSDEEMYEPSIAAEDEEGPEGDLESEVTDPVPPSAGGPAVPAEPTAAERAAHALTHLPFQPWCDDCVSGKSKESPHRRRSAEEEVSVERLPVVQIDYRFLGRECDELPEESALLTILVAVDVESGYPFALQVPRKGMEQGKYALENLELFLNRLGYDKVILQHDAEHAVGAVAKALQRHLGSARVRVRSALS